MKRWILILVVLAAIVLPVAYAHLCNNVYRTPSRFVIKPEKPITFVEKSDEVRIFVQNNFPVTVNKVMLTANSEDGVVETEVVPAVVDAMRPGTNPNYS